MARLEVTIVGLDLIDLIFSRLKEAGIEVNGVNPVNEGRLGNFKTLTYAFDIPDDDIIYKRRAFMNGLAEENMLLPMYEHGDWCSVYIFGKWAFKPR